MGAFGVALSILHFVGLYVQLNAASTPGDDFEVDNHIFGNALFTEVPHDVVTESGQDVEMACSFRGAGSPSVSLEIQWWYIRNHREWSEQTSWANNQVVPMEEMVKDATKISVVKVAGSNISHKLRLSNVKTSDEGTYECRVIDFSDSHAQHHRVRAYLQVQPPGEGKAQPTHTKHEDDQPLHQEAKHPHPHPHPQHPHSQHHQHQHPASQQPHQGDHRQKDLHHHVNEPGQQNHHHREQPLQEHQRPHVANHHKKTEGEKEEPEAGTPHKQQAHSGQSESKEMKRRPVEGASDCAADNCGH